MSEVPEFSNLSIDPENLAQLLYMNLVKCLALVDIISSYDINLDYLNVFHSLRMMYYNQFDDIFHTFARVLEFYQVFQVKAIIWTE